jgi:hypothetical protein
MTPDGRPRWEYNIWNPAVTWNGTAHVIGGVSAGLTTWEAVLDWMGRNGWELVAVTDRPYAEMPNRPPRPGTYADERLIADPATYFFFKRPRLD